MLLVSSDPYISSIRNLKAKHIQEFSDEIKALLIIENDETDENDENDALNQSLNDIDLNN